MSLFDPPNMIDNPHACGVGFFALGAMRLWQFVSDAYLNDIKDLDGFVSKDGIEAYPTGLLSQAGDAVGKPPVTLTPVGDSFAQDDYTLRPLLRAGTG